MTQSEIQRLKDAVNKLAHEHGDEHESGAVFFHAGFIPKLRKLIGIRRLSIIGRVMLKADAIDTLTASAFRNCGRGVRVDDPGYYENL